MADDTQVADVLEQDGPEQTADEQEQAVAEKVGDAEADAESQKTDAEIHPKKKGGWLRKIEKLERENSTLIEALRKVGGVPAEAAQNGNRAEAEDKAPEKPVRPKIADFEDFKLYDAAMSKYEDDKDSYQDRLLAHKLKQERQADAQRAQQQQTVKSWESKISEAKKVHADFEEVAFSEDTPVSPAMADAITDSELGTEILYFLGQNQKEAERIAKLSPLAAIREIGKIESRIADKNAADKETEAEPPETASKAPRPPQTVRRPANVATGEPGPERPYSEWLKWREAQLKAK